MYRMNLLSKSRVDQAQLIVDTRNGTKAIKSSKIVRC